MGSERGHAWEARQLLAKAARTDSPILANTFAAMASAHATLAVNDTLRSLISPAPSVSPDAP